MGAEWRRAKERSRGGTDERQEGANERREHKERMEEEEMGYVL